MDAGPASNSAPSQRMCIGTYGTTQYMPLGDAAKAKAAYQDFLALWKYADLDIPIYKQAKAEYAKLQ